MEEQESKLEEQTIKEQLDTVKETLAAISHQISYIPPQVRAIGNKIQGLDASISEPKYKNLLRDVVMIYDLIDQSLRALEGQEQKHRQNYQVIKTQIVQVLAANGLEEIATKGKFDPKIHKAMKCVEVEQKEQDGDILEIVRPGFRTSNFILRYAEVVIGKHE